MGISSTAVELTPALSSSGSRESSCRVMLVSSSAIVDANVVPAGDLKPMALREVKAVESASGLRVMAI